MSCKNIDLFINFLDECKLKKITPRAFTSREIVMFGQTKGFDFTMKELIEKIEKINNSPDEKLGIIEKIWKGKEVKNVN